MEQNAAGFRYIDILQAKGKPAWATKMFNFFLDAGNYESRKVARYEENDVIVDTVRCSDGRQPYETGVCHPEYNDGDWVIVEAYDSPEEAQKGHNDWVKKMTSKSLPAKLQDCRNAIFAATFFDEENLEYPRTVEAGFSPPRIA